MYDDDCDSLVFVCMFCVRSVLVFISGQVDEWAYGARGSSYEANEGCVDYKTIDRSILIQRVHVLWAWVRLGFRLGHWC